MKRITVEPHVFVIDMRSIHTWRYEIEAMSFTEAVRKIINTTEGDDPSYDQREIDGHTLPSTASLVEIRPVLWTKRK